MNDCGAGDSDSCNHNDTPRSTTVSDQDSGYRIIDLDILKNQIMVDLVCKHCHCASNLIEEKRSGLESIFRFNCENKKCSAETPTKPFHSDPTIQVNKNGLVNHSINRRLALAMRYIGCGHSGLSTFCGIMNLPPPVKTSSFETIQDSLLQAVIAVQSKSMKDAAKLEYQQSTSSNEEDYADADDDSCPDIDNTSPRDIDVSVDGTYMTRGFSSKVGVVTAIGCLNGKVIDTELKSKVCKSCDFWEKREESDPSGFEKWKRSHSAVCEATHEGSSGSMEAACGLEIFSRSVEKNNLRYTRFIGDGDTNTFKKVSESKPYGEKMVEKIECVGHVQKRMGTRLQKLKTTHSGKKLKDGKKVNGQGRLTDSQIDSIQTYFGGAIRNHKNDSIGMRNAIWAIFFHKLSTDKNPRHHHCDKSWCKYLQAKEDPRIK